MRINFRPAETFRGTRIYRQANNLAYAYETNHKAVDADGAPNAYHPDDTGLDLLANAGYGHPRRSWWREVLVPDPGNPSEAYVQAAGPFKGYFVSMTALRELNGNPLDPATYVDATRVPYVVIPTGFSSLRDVAKKGDVGFATHIPSGKTTAFIVGDAGGGNNAKLGEGSIALFAALGGQRPNPRNGRGVPAGNIQYIIFPRSGSMVRVPWPRSNEDIRRQVMRLLSTTPGISAPTRPVLRA